MLNNKDRTEQGKISMYSKFRSLFPVHPPIQHKHLPTDKSDRTLFWQPGYWQAVTNSRRLYAQGSQKTIGSMHSTNHALKAVWLEAFRDFFEKAWLNFAKGGLDWFSQIMRRYFSWRSTCSLIQSKWIHFFLILYNSRSFDNLFFDLCGSICCLHEAIVAFMMHWDPGSLKEQFRILQSLLLYTY